MLHTIITWRISYIDMTAFPSKDFIIGYGIGALLPQYLNAYHYTSNRMLFGHGVSHGQCVIKRGVVISDSSKVASRILIRLGMIITLEPDIYVDMVNRIFE
ncbi:unnamed protein product [Adineta ricciae]|uniref:Uncharacterized protein n=1 Tax=Adineta ricciae TaxID=249248 RepID=A0A814UME3_ADIRI|nr:unnamed protein product [Adineta ricciae]CAF1294096.1 unnamed protein product [Adineta ricciae]